MNKDSGLEDESKYVASQIQFTCEVIKWIEIKVLCVPSEENTDDILTTELIRLFSRNNWEKWESRLAELELTRSPHQLTKNIWV